MAINMNVDPINAETRLNRGDWNYAPGKNGSQIVRRSKRVYKGVYNFAVSGGAVGTIALMDPVFAAPFTGTGGNVPLYLPANFIISNVLIDVITALTSGGSATVALTSGQNAADLLAATGYGSAPFTGTIAAGIPVSAATAIKIPSTQAAPGSAVSMVIATAALTAGAFNVHIEGFLSDLN